MQEFDIALKLLLRRSAHFTMRELTGATIDRWLDVELPRMQNPRLDLLGETAEGELVHIELQSTNDNRMALRMAEYCVGILRLCDRLPRQIVVYVGEAPLRMEREIRGDDLHFRYRLVDIREMDGDRLLESPEVGDNVIAVLMKLHDRREAVRKIVARIAALPSGADRRTALDALYVLAGLRRLAGTVDEEAKDMPLIIDIRENEVLGPVYQRGLEEGERRGEAKGKAEGILEGQFTLIRNLIEKRFGEIPDWAEQRLAKKSSAELEQLSVQLLDAQSLQELLPEA